MLQTTKLSNKGQVVIPQLVRERCGLKAGDEFVVVETEEGILLQPRHHRIAQTSVDQVFGILAYKGSAKTLEDMEDAIRQGVQEGC